MQKSETGEEEENNNKNNIPLKYISLREFILFKEEILKSLNDFKKDINSNLTKEKEKTDLFLEKASNIIKSDNNKNIFLSKIKFIEEKDVILSQIKKLETDFNNQLMINKINLATHEKDFSEACFKYDKIISDNLLVSGLIGISCKYPNLKEYILNNKEEVSINSLEIKKIEMELKEYKNKMENINENLKFQIMTMRNNFQAFMELKTNEMNKKYEEFEKTITEKIHRLNVKNTGFVENLKEQEDKMVNGVKFLEKIKEDTIENNNNAIHTISKENKNIANQLIQVKKEFKSFKKNIMDLSTLLMKKDSDKNKKNKEAVITSFNDMMTELIKETFIKEKKNEFNYNNFNSYNINNNNFPSLMLSNNDNQSYFRENNKQNQFKIRTLTHNITKDINEEEKKMSLKIKLNINNNNNGPIIKSKFSNEINNKNNKLSFDNNNDENEQNDLMKKKTMTKNIRSSYTFGNKKVDKKLEKKDDNDNKKEVKKEKEKNLTIENIEKKIDKINKNSIIFTNMNNKNKNNKADSDTENKKNQIENNTSKKEKDKIINENKNNENIIVTKEKEEKTNEKEEKKRDDIEEKKLEKEENEIEKKEDKNEKQVNNESNKEEEIKINFMDEENKGSDKEGEKCENNKEKNVSEPNVDKELNNEKINNNNNKTYSNQSNPKSISFRFDNNSLKELEKQKSLLLQNNNNNKKLFNKMKNIKQINILNNNNGKGQNYNKRSQTLKNDLPITKSIFSLYDYLKTSKNKKYFKNNKTEDFDYSRAKSKEKINQGDIYKKILSKDVLERIKIIKDEDIIDKPLLCNQENFEVRKSTGDLEKKILHLEYFMKKKLDELVREIKIFIPIHFNSHTRDYNVIEKQQ